jgi:hypothetical protein
MSALQKMKKASSTSSSWGLTSPRPLPFMTGPLPSHWRLLPPSRGGLEDLGNGPSVFWWFFDGEDHIGALGVGERLGNRLTSSSSASPLVLLWADPGQVLGLPLVCQLPIGFWSPDGFQTPLGPMVPHWSWLTAWRVLPPNLWRLVQLATLFQQSPHTKLAV